MKTNSSPKSMMTSSRLMKMLRTKSTPSDNSMLSKDTELPEQKIKAWTNSRKLWKRRELILLWLSKE